MYSIYIISHDERIAKDMYKVGRHHGNENALKNRYLTSFIDPIILFFESVNTRKQCIDIENKIKKILKNHRYKNKNGNLTEWYCMKLEKLKKNIENIIKLMNGDSYCETIEKDYLMFVHEKSKIHAIIDDDKKIWFNLNQTLTAVNYRDVRDASRRLVDRKYTKRNKFINVNNIKGQPNSLYINQSGLYRLMTRSRMPSAIRFSN